MEEIIKIETKGEYAIVLGDFNKHVGDIIEGNSDKVTEGGKLIKDFLKNGEYVLLNSLTDKVIGGPFTRVEPSDPENNEKKSCLDFIIVSKGLAKYVESVEIDRERKVTPCHAINTKS